MGVRGLQTFMERSCPNVACEVNIKDIVETYRRETGREVVIVVDGSSCLRPLYGKLDWVCGGQTREYTEAIYNFIQAFLDIGVKLVFFFDGPTQARKRKVWIERRMQSMQDVFKVFDHIEKGLHPSRFSHDTVMLPPATSYLASHAISTSHGCEVHRSVNECDEEIAEYAVKHNCFAILGQDSDYVIYEGPKYYLSATHLNIEKMTTINYNRWELARRLRLSPRLLPLLASLVGNDIIRSDELLHFHRRICNSTNQRRRPYPQPRPNPRDIIYNVATFIRSNTNERHVFEALPMISRRVFGNEHHASQLLLSVRSYSVNTNHGSQPESFNFMQQSSNAEASWKNIQKCAEIRFKDGDLDSMLYAIMHELPYESSTGLEDFRRTELPPSAAAYRVLRQHIYGITLHERPGDTQNHVVEEWCMQGEGSLSEPFRVSLILPPPGLHPGLKILWNDKDTSAELLTKKWKLLANAVSKDLDPDKLRSIPTTLLAPTLLLFYLCHEVSPPFLESWEVDAFIATAVTLHTYSTSSLAALQISRAVPRAVQLACIFGRGASVIKMLVDACGRPVPTLEVSSWHYFDGKLFQTIYQKAQSGSKAVELCNHQVAQLEQFQLIQSIVHHSQE